MTFSTGTVPEIGHVTTTADPLHDSWNDDLTCSHGVTSLTRFSTDESPLTLQAWAYAAQQHTQRFGCSCLQRFLDVHVASRQEPYFPPA